MDRRDRSQPVKTGTKGTKVKATIACRASSSSTLHNPPARHQVSDTLERDSRRVPPLLNNGAVFDTRPGRRPGVVKLFLPGGLQPENAGRFDLRLPEMLRGGGVGLVRRTS